MSYDPNIPQPTDFLSDSQAQILSNFTVSNNVMDINHFPFNDATINKGKHKFVEMPNTTIPATIANEASIYTKQATSTTATTQSQLFITSDIGANEYQLTRSIDSAFSYFGQNLAVAAFAAGSPTSTGGWTFLPGGLLLQYGVFQWIPPFTNGSIKYPTTFTTAVYSVQLTVQNSLSPTAALSLASIAFLDHFNFSAVGFPFNASAFYYYIAVGK